MKKESKWLLPPEMAHTVGVSKSQVSREFVEESEKKLKKLCERRFDDKDIIAVYVDGIQYGDCHVIVALGVDSGGHKHVLGIREGSSENSRVASDLLVDMVERGIRADRLRLFVTCGSKALRCAIDAVYGPDNPVQRCRNHKVRNVMDYLLDAEKRFKRIMGYQQLWILDARLKELAESESFGAQSHVA